MKHIITDKLAVEITALAGLQVVLFMEIEKQRHTLLHLETLNLTDVEHIRGMCKNKSKCILHMKDLKLRDFAKFLTKNVKDDKVEIIDNTDYIPFNSGIVLNQTYGLNSLNITNGGSGQVVAGTSCKSSTYGTLLTYGTGKMV